MDSLSNILNAKVDDFIKQNDFDIQINLPKVENKSINDFTLSPILPANTESFEADFKPPINIDQLKIRIKKIRDDIEEVWRIIDGQAPLDSKTEAVKNPIVLNGGERIVEGVFNGEKMVGEDGKEYSVPPNYASKSKLVEGDIMKLNITTNGSFIYKQVGPIARRRIIGELTNNSATGQWGVSANGKIYKILTASVTFFRGKAGDEIIILVPKDGDSDWGAVENIIRK